MHYRDPFDSLQCRGRSTFARQLTIKLKGQSQPRLLQQDGDVVEADPDHVEALFRNVFVAEFRLKPRSELRQEFKERLVVDHLHALAHPAVDLNGIGPAKILQIVSGTSGKTLASYSKVQNRETPPAYFLKGCWSVKRINKKIFTIW